MVKIIATASKNTITRNGKKIAPYFKMVDGKKFSFNGFSTRKLDLLEFENFRKKRFGFKHRIVKVSGGYIAYTGK